MSLGKWNSRKLFSFVASVVAGYFFPPLIPLLKIVAPTVIAGFAVQDAATQLGGAIRDTPDKSTRILEGLGGLVSALTPDKGAPGKPSGT